MNADGVPGRATGTAAVHVARLAGNLMDAQTLDFDVAVAPTRGTAAAVQAWQAKTPRVHLLQRPGKMGLGSAYRDGFKFALSHGAEYIFEMDADFSHDPGVLGEFLKHIGDADIVTPEHAVEMFRTIPGSRLCVVPDAGHGAMPAETVRAFLAAYARPLPA